MLRPCQASPGFCGCSLHAARWGAIIVLMLWFYLSGFALLVGAELNAEIE
jgi:hypothetical protein